MNWDSKQFHWNLKTRRFGRDFRYLEEVDSTNRWLSENLINCTLPGSLVVAGHQLSGRGRHARSWLDHVGHSLLFSLLLHSKRKIERPGFLTLLPAISLARVLASHDSSAQISLKWPNDVQAGGKKIAGILAEAHQHDGYVSFVVGVGVNVSQSRNDFTESGLHDASSIHAETSWRPSREIVLAHILNEWESLFDLMLDSEYDEIRREWGRFGPAKGAPIRRVEADDVVEGCFEGLGESGQLMMLDSRGCRQEFHSGDVILI